MKIQFAPGCFDDFEGTQEELDEFIQEITALVESGEFMNMSKPLDLESLIEEDPELAMQIMEQMNILDTVTEDFSGTVDHTATRKRRMN